MRPQTTSYAEKKIFSGQKYCMPLLSRLCGQLGEECGELAASISPHVLVLMMYLTTHHIFVFISLVKSVIHGFFLRGAFFDNYKITRKDYLFVAASEDGNKI